jgi:ribosomal protein L44E
VVVRQEDLLMKSIKTIFDMNERLFPSSFVIFEKEPFTAANEKDKLKRLQRVVGKLRDLYGAFTDPIPAIEARLQESVVLKLVCELCGSAMPPGYTIRKPKEVVVKYFPLARAGIAFSNVIIHYECSKIEYIYVCIQALV